MYHTAVFQQAKHKQIHKKSQGSKKTFYQQKSDGRQMIVSLGKAQQFHQRLSRNLRYLHTLLSSSIRLMRYGLLEEFSK